MLFYKFFRKKFVQSRIFAGCLLLVIIAFLPACTKVYEGLKPPTDVDVVEKAPVGLDIEVSDFKWTYVSGGKIQVSGQVINKSGQSHGNLNLFTMLFDETGRAVAMGEARIMPASLQNGQTGEFQLTMATSRPSGIAHIRLLSNIKSGL